MTSAGRTDSPNKKKSRNAAPHLEMSLYSKADDRQNKHSSVYYEWINLLKLSVYLQSCKESLRSTLLHLDPSSNSHTELWDTRS